MTAQYRAVLKFCKTGRGRLILTLEGAKEGGLDSGRDKKEKLRERERTRARKR